MTFDKFREARKEAATRKYTIYYCHICNRVIEESISGGHLTNGVLCEGLANPVNAAMHRNCALDVAEELADALNILDMWDAKRLLKSEPPFGAGVIGDMNLLRAMGARYMTLAKDGRDEYPVRRRK